MRGAERPKPKLIELGDPVERVVRTSVRVARAVGKPPELSEDGKVHGGAQGRLEFRHRHVALPAADFTLGVGRVDIVDLERQVHQPAARLVRTGRRRAFRKLDGCSADIQEDDVLAWNRADDRKAQRLVVERLGAGIVRRFERDVVTPQNSHVS